MSIDVVRVLAEVRMLATADGGKTCAIRQSYRPNHNFFDTEDAEMTIGFLEIPEGIEVEPGGSITLPISFWAWPGLSEIAVPGREWRIQEGHQVVGIGRVIEVLSDVPECP